MTSASVRPQQSVVKTRFDDVAVLAIADAKYVVRLATIASEIDAALKLRFEVFNLELGEGLAALFKPDVIAMNSTPPAIT
jgi:putative hemolysin